MKFLANENVPQASIAKLKAAGYDITSVGLEFSGISDRDVIQLAIDESRVIITFDRDYGELIFKYGYRPAHGVIYLRWKHYKPEDPGIYLVSLLKECEVDFACALTVIGDDSVRQRKYRV